jgi:hypothetical protein
MTGASWFRRVLREPLLHFLLIGFALFVAYGWLGPAGGGDRIVVTRSTTDELARQFAARWMRQPTAQELSGLVDTWVREEIFYREGQALGLDRDDPVIKRRLRQKLEVMQEESLGGDAPTDAALGEYLARHADRFRAPARVTFEQIYVPGRAPVAEVERSIAAARQALERGADPRALGQPMMLAQRYDDASVDTVSQDFGAGFAARVAAAPVGEWQGPIASAYGAHLVRVSTRRAGVLPALDDIRPAVIREWERDRRAQAAAEAYAEMRGRYRVEVEAKP